MSTVVVTGASRGIGFEVSRQLASAGARVVLVCRDGERGRRAREAVAAAGAAPVLVVADLSSLRGMREAAAAIADACPRLDVLVHNAGLWPSRLVRTEDGWEESFAVNHVAPFLLNHLLQPLLSASRAHVVQVSSGLYAKGRVDLAKTPTGDDFHPLRTYATTKLCNVLMLPLFARRFGPLGITVNALHPGVIRTNLGHRDGALGLVLRMVKRLWKSPEVGARAVVRLATDPTLSALTGRYYHVDAEAPLVGPARDLALAERLWRDTAALVGLAGEAAHVGEAHG